jgi:hypothetical protein
MMRYDVYGGHSGLVVQAIGVTAEEARERFEAFMAQPVDGTEFRVECVSDELRADRDAFEASISSRGTAHE